MKVALISDIHEDIISLQLALSKIKRSGCTEIWCLGDISGYSIPNFNYFELRNASGCLKLILERCSIIISGNHDLNAAKKNPVLNPEFKFPDNWFDLDYIVKKDLSYGKIWLYEPNELNPLYAEKERERIRMFPEFSVVKINGFAALLSHYIFPNVTGVQKNFYHNPEEYRQHRGWMKEKKSSIAFVGHRHFPGIMIARENKIIKKSFGRKVDLKEDDIVLVPPVSMQKGGSGFVILDTINMKVVAKRI